MNDVLSIMDHVECVTLTKRAFFSLVAIIWPAVDNVQKRVEIFVLSKIVIILFSSACACLSQCESYDEYLTFFSLFGGH